MASNKKIRQSSTERNLRCSEEALPLKLAGGEGRSSSKQGKMKTVKMDLDK